MHFLRGETSQIFVVTFVSKVKLIVYQPGIFFLKQFLKDAFHFVSVLVITFVFGTSSMKKSDRHLMPRLNSWRSFSKCDLMV